MRKIKNILVNITIFLIILILFFIICEITIRLSNNCEISPLKTGNLFTFFKKTNNLELQYELKPTSKGYLLGKNVEINSQGLRDYEYNKEKLDNIYRICVIGDSVTFGFGVNLNESYPKILEEKLDNTDIINFGVPGYVGSQEFVVLKEKVLDYNPNLIIIGHFLNDPDGIWNPYETTVPMPVSIKVFLNEHSCFYNWCKNRWNRVLRKSSIIKEVSYKELYKGEIWEKYKTLIENISEISKEKEIPILFVILPVWENFGDYEFINEHLLLSKVIKEKDLYVLDLFPKVKELDANEYKLKGDSAHPNYEGHKIIANILYDYLIKNNLVNN